MKDHIHVDRKIKGLSTRAVANVTGISDEVGIYIAKEADRNATTKLLSAGSVEEIESIEDISRIVGGENKLYRCAELERCPEVLTREILEGNKEHIAKSDRLHLVVVGNEIPMELYEYALERGLDIHIYNALSPVHEDIELFTEEELVENSLIPDDYSDNDEEDYLDENDPDDEEEDGEGDGEDGDGEEEEEEDGEEDGEEQNDPITRAELIQAISDGDDLTDLNVSEITDFSGIFQDVEMYTGNISGWDVSAATNMDNMFHHAYSFEDDISGWNVENVTSMDYMFKGTELFNVDISGWNTGNVTSMHGTFLEAGSFSQDLSGWDVANVTDHDEFDADSSLTTDQLPNWVEEAAGALTREELIAMLDADEDVTQADVSQITDFSLLFQGRNRFNQDISGWDTGSATNMAMMFVGAAQFNQNINSWNVENVTNMTKMFRSTASFNSPLDQWDVGNVTNMSYMFYNARVFDQNIDNWDVGSVIGHGFVSMFRGAYEFNQPLNSWQFNAGVQSLTRMLNGAKKFDQPLDNWTFGNIMLSMDYMFDGALVFNQDISGWNTSKVKIMTRMLSSCHALQVDLSGWDVDDVTSHNYFANNSPGVIEPVWS